MDRKGFYIFCDESVKQDRYYSNFYGGSMIGRADHAEVNKQLLEVKAGLGMEDSELKWSNINTFRVNAYCQMMSAFFEEVKLGRIKVRVMFTDNRNIATGITAEQRKLEYHLLYYQFIKHAFGFMVLESDYEIDLELYFDSLPDNHAKNKRFKDFIYGLQFLPELAAANLRIEKKSIYEVDSKKHIILQCTDVILGAMAFRLNDHHEAMPKGAKRRAKRTIAKHKVYKHINSLIREIRPNFNIGISTGSEELIERFTGAYRHWLFTPSEYEYKRGSKKKRPSIP